ncbi:hypothetical protein F5Y16DRAFT_417501 [Xylariaceae sp. FL0255]|nr:hypothetical protein F5Y16DRAFT_417501 [Xylariaceae sp. FL0255]
MSDPVRSLQPPSESRRSSSRGSINLDAIWDEAAWSFEEICGESLRNGTVKDFDDLQQQIERSNKRFANFDIAEQDKWDLAKRTGLKSLKYLRTLIGATVDATSFIPIPSSAANMAASAMGMIFNIPAAIKGYSNAINQVFNEVSTALSQFQIYKELKHLDYRLIERIHLTLVSFVKICAHVVKYRQGRKGERLLQQVGAIFDDDSGLAKEMEEFKRHLQAQRLVEGTATFKTTTETHDKVQSLFEEADRIKTLNKIRETLGVASTVRLDSRTTQTCTEIYRKCVHGTGEWLWTNPAFMSWKSPKGTDISSVLIISGPASSGKTSATALITRHLEEEKGRTYVAHFFFQPSTNKSEEEKHPVHAALKYIAFQIARADEIVTKALGKTCEANSGLFSNSLSLDDLWRQLKIGGSSSNVTNYIVFDGLENLPEKQSEALLKFIFGPLASTKSTGRLRVLVSARDDSFTSPAISSFIKSSLRIQLEQHNMADMRIIIDDTLSRQGILANAKPNSSQHQAKEKIMDKVPRKVKGNYSSLQFELDEFIRLLSTRTTVKELDQMLDHETSSHELAIRKLQRSLTLDEVSELNELLKWVLFGLEPMHLHHLEAAMFLYSGAESLSPLQYIIKNKYHSVLKMIGTQVCGHDGVKNYFQEIREELNKQSDLKDRSTISMTIAINNALRALSLGSSPQSHPREIQIRIRRSFQRATKQPSDDLRLAKYYFESSITSTSSTLLYVDELSKLAEADADDHISDSPGYLGALYATHGKADLSRNVLRRRVRQALQLLSDDNPDNDWMGFLALLRTLSQYGDMKNAAIALSLLGHPGLVEDALRFNDKDPDIPEDCTDKRLLLGILKTMARDTIDSSRSNVRDARQQLHRVNEALVYITSLRAALHAKNNPNINISSRHAHSHSHSHSSSTSDPYSHSSSQTHARPHSPTLHRKPLPPPTQLSPLPSVYETVAAHLIQTRLSSLLDKFSPRQQLNSEAAFTGFYRFRCDGPGRNGNGTCGNVADFNTHFYRCVYCSNVELCGECLGNLKQTHHHSNSHPHSAGIETQPCSPNHKWLLIPAMGSDLYVGPKAKRVRPPVKVNPFPVPVQRNGSPEYREDSQVLAIRRDEKREPEVSVEEWKSAIAREWEISPEEIRQGEARNGGDR